MKYVLELKHYFPPTISVIHKQISSGSSIGSNTLWGLLREARKNRLEDEFYLALKRHLRNL